MARRRIVFRKARAQSAARRILFTSPAPELLEDPLAGHDFTKSVTGEMVDLMCKACVDGDITPDDLARVSKAWGAGKALPDDLRPDFAKALL
jgi:hypothetical protein